MAGLDRKLILSYLKLQGWDFSSRLGFHFLSLSVSSSSSSMFMLLDYWEEVWNQGYS